MCYEKTKDCIISENFDTFCELARVFGVEEKPADVTDLNKKAAEIDNAGFHDAWLQALLNAADEPTKKILLDELLPENFSGDDSELGDLSTDADLLKKLFNTGTEIVNTVKKVGTEAGNVINNRPIDQGVKSSRSSTVDLSAIPNAKVSQSSTGDPKILGMPKPLAYAIIGVIVIVALVIIYKMVKK